MSAVPRPPEPPAPPGPVPPPPRPPRTGRLVLGVLLVLFGAGWLLDTLDVTDFPWETVLPVVLILIGVALLVTARSTNGRGGLIMAGGVLAVVLLLGSAVDFPFGGGIGDREVRPHAVEALRDEYRLGVGELRLDLTALPDGDLFAWGDSLRARVGIGRLVVIVPRGDGSIRIEGRAGLGNVDLFGFGEGGFDVERTTLSPPTANSWGFELVLSVGLGEVEVRYG